MTASERDMSATQEGVGISDAINPFLKQGNDHMKILKSLSQSAGIDVPLYTATGWGNAAIIPPDTISSSLLSNLTINLAKLLGAV